MRITDLIDKMHKSSRDTGKPAFRTFLLYGSIKTIRKRFVISFTLYLHMNRLLVLEKCK